MSVLVRPQGFELIEFLDWMDNKYQSRAKTKLWRKALEGYNTKNMIDAREWMQQLFMDKYEAMFIDYARDWTAIIWPGVAWKLRNIELKKSAAEKAVDRDNRLRNIFHGEEWGLDRRRKNDWKILQEEDMETGEIIYSQLPGEALPVDESINLTSSIKSISLINSIKSVDHLETSFPEQELTALPVDETINEHNLFIDEPVYSNLEEFNYQYMIQPNQDK